MTQLNIGFKRRKVDRTERKGQENILHINWGKKQELGMNSEQRIGNKQDAQRTSNGKRYV